VNFLIRVVFLVLIETKAVDHVPNFTSLRDCLYRQLVAVCQTLCDAVAVPDDIALELAANTTPV
jgi:hypothetical protein